MVWKGKGRFWSSFLSNGKHISVNYESVLPALQSFIKLFQTSAPMIHVLHDEIVSLFRQFLAYFIKPQFIPVSIKQLTTSDCSDKISCFLSLTGSLATRLNLWFHHPRNIYASHSSVKSRLPLLNVLNICRRLCPLTVLLCKFCLFWIRQLLVTVLL